MTRHSCQCGSPIASGSKLCAACIVVRNDEIVRDWGKSTPAELAARYELSITRFRNVALELGLTKKRKGKQASATVEVKQPRSRGTSEVVGYTLPGVTQRVDLHRPLPPPKRCAWPHGDPGAPGFRFCGDPSEDGRPYCDAHCAAAYVGYQRRLDHAA